MGGVTLGAPSDLAGAELELLDDESAGGHVILLGVCCRLFSRTVCAMGLDNSSICDRSPFVSVLWAKRSVLLRFARILDRCDRSMGAQRCSAVDRLFQPTWAIRRAFRCGLDARAKANLYPALIPQRWRLEGASCSKSRLVRSQIEDRNLP